MSEDASRYIPTDIKRAVRQRCRFGCVMCGFPIFVYDHMQDFADVKEHTADNITLLCSNHHTEKTARRLSRAIVQSANANPHNAKVDITPAHRLHFAADELRFVVGSNTFVGRVGEGESFSAIVFQNEPLLSFKREQGNLLLSLMLRDVLLNPVAKIVEGELTLSTGIKDMTFIGPRLRVVPRFSPRPLSLAVFENGVNVDQGFFYGRGSTLEVAPNLVIQHPREIGLSGGYLEGARVGANFP